MKKIIVNLNITILILLLILPSYIYAIETTQPTVWKCLAIIFKNTDFNFTTNSGEQWIEKNTMSDEEIDIIIKMTEHFKHDLTEDSHGKIKIELDVKVIDTPITELISYTDTDGYMSSEHAYALIKDTIDINQYDHITALTSISHGTTYMGLGGIYFRENIGYSFINTGSKDYCLWVFDENQMWPPSVMIHEFLHFIETWSCQKIGFAIPINLHSGPEHGYENVNGWRAWYTDFINRQVQLEDGRKTGVLDITWQTPPRIYNANLAAGYRNGINPMFVETESGIDTNYIWYGSAYKKQEATTFTLTDLHNSTAGSVWLNQPINTRNNFIVNFSYYAGEGRGDYWNGADGIVLAFNNKEHRSGNRNNMDFISEGSYGVELDSYPKESGDPEKKHIAITTDGTVNHLTYVEDDRVDDSKWHNVKVEYIDHSLIVYLDGERILSSDHINFKDEFIYVGLYARTGSGKNRHEISNLTVTEGEPARNDKPTIPDTNPDDKPTIPDDKSDDKPTIPDNKSDNKPTISDTTDISQNRIIKFKIGESKYTLNGQSIAMDAASYIQNPGFTMVPIRYVAEALGVPSKNITFSNGTVTIQMNARTIQLTNNSDIAKVNGAEVKIGTKVAIEKGRTYAPIGEVAQLLGIAKEWDNITKTATFIN